MSTKSSYLIFWMLIRVWETPNLVHEIRDEIARFAQTTQPPQIFGIPELPRLKLDLDGLVNSCPLLKACFHETLRLHSMPISVRSVPKDVIVGEAKGPGPSYALDAGSIIAAPLGLHHHDPRFFESPFTFQPRRFLESSESAEGKQTVIERTLRPWGVGEYACPGRAYAEQEVLAFVASILALWDFEPGGNGKWIVPKQTERAVVSVPSGDVRVRLRPRQLS